MVKFKILQFSSVSGNVFRFKCFSIPLSIYLGSKDSFLHDETKMLTTLTSEKSGCEQNFESKELTMIRHLENNNSNKCFTKEEDTYYTKFKLTVENKDEHDM